MSLKIDAEIIKIFEENEKHFISAEFFENNDFQQK